MSASVLAAISTTRDPLNGRFVNVHKCCSTVVSNKTESFVDLIIQRDGGPYIRVRMTLDAAKLIADDMQEKLAAAIDGVECSPWWSENTLVPAGQEISKTHFSAGDGGTDHHIGCTCPACMKLAHKKK